jgi:acetyl/propionyl-CoA carboxylase alpha subunit
MDQNGRFERIAIVNRGEPAMRLIRAVREYNREHGTALRTIALPTTPDHRAMFVREADESYDLGEPTFTDERDGRRKSSYLDHLRLERALTATGAEAVWVGWGFVAEHADFVELCDRLGITFIGPSASVMRRLGDKISAKRIAEEAGVPVAAWSGGPVGDVAAARVHGERLGYPLMIKASAGGGGRGIRRVNHPEELEEAFTAASSETVKAFGDGTLFMERLVDGARHVEVQMMGDAAGTVWGLGVRDCSIQRRNQKIIEEAPSPALSPEQDADLRAAAVRLGVAAGYTNAGTVEFLYDEAEGHFYFMEVNARLQVEHPITELTTGADLVKLQIHVARGGRLDPEPPPSRGHAIEARLNAEDPDRRFSPSPGRIDIFRTATGPGVRIDTGVEEGDEVAPQFDSMIAKVIAFGKDREEALARLGRALAETSVVIRDGASNKAFLQHLLDRPEVRAGTVDVGWLDRIGSEEVDRPYADVALLQAAIDGYDAEIAVEKARFRESAQRGRPEVSGEGAQSVELHYRGHTYAFTVRRLDPLRYRIEVDDGHLDVSVERVGPFDARLTWNGETYRVITVPHGLRHFVEVNGVPHHVSPDRGGVVRAQSPAVVVSVAVAPGDRVEKGARLVVLEAMKMEMAVLAEFAGTVREVHIRANVQVPTGAPLLTVDPSGEEEAMTVAGRVRFGDDTSPGRAHAGPACLRLMEDFRRMLMGYDIDPVELGKRITARGTLCDDLPPTDEDRRALENRVLGIFLDVISLFRRRPPDVEEDVDMRRSSEEYLFAYLRDLDGRGAGLPESFLTKLRRALAHYGVEGLDHTPRLDDALFRITTSYQRMDGQLAPILAVLEGRLEDPAAAYAGNGSRELLDRLIVETYGRYGLIHDVAREVHYRTFDQPFLDEVRNSVYQEAALDLSYLMVNPDGTEREERIASLVGCPQPLKVVISSVLGEASPAARRALLEIMVRRYYRIRDLRDLQHVESAGIGFLTAEYDHDGRRIRLLAGHCGPEDVGRVVAAATPLTGTVPADHDVILDCYVWDPGVPLPPDEQSLVLTKVIAENAGPRPLRRLVVAVSSKSAGWGMGALEHFTFRPGPDGYHEEKPYRGLHPMMAKRLELWRLQNFDIERVPSVEDVYVFSGVARENPGDRRLFVLAEVRDITPIRDEEGRVARLP